MKHLIRIITLVILFQSSFAKLNDAMIVQLQRHYRTADYKVGLQKAKEEIRSSERKKDSVRQVRLAILYSYQALFQKSISKENEYLISLNRAKENLLSSTASPYFSCVVTLPFHLSTLQVPPLMVLVSLVLMMMSQKSLYYNRSILMVGVSKILIFGFWHKPKSHHSGRDLNSSTYMDPTSTTKEEWHQ